MRQEKRLTKTKSLVPHTHIEAAILTQRGHRVMLDADLAALYGVTTKVLLQAVKRNRERFPPDFMFQLTREEFADLRSHSVTSSSGQHGGRRYPPYAFTEQGVAMLSTVLRSSRAIKVNIEIMRAFVRLRGVLATHAELSKRLDELEARYDRQFKAVFDAIRGLMTSPQHPARRIGFGSPSDPKALAARGSSSTSVGGRPTSAESSSPRPARRARVSRRWGSRAPRGSRRNPTRKD